MRSEAPITRVHAAAFRVPTDGPEADGTFAWDSTVIVVVNVEAGGMTGLGYTYAAAGAASLVNTTLGRQDHLREGIAVCEQTLGLYDGPKGTPREDHADWRGLGREARLQLAEDRRELLLLLAGARVRLAPGDRPTLGRSLALLDEAEAIRGLAPSRALWFDRASYWLIKPGQITQEFVFGAGSKSYDTTNMVLEKFQGDLFRNWVIGLGSGDLRIQTMGANHDTIDIPNVLFVTRKVALSQEMISIKPDAFGAVTVK